MSKQCSWKLMLGRLGDVWCQRDEGHDAGHRFAFTLSGDEVAAINKLPTHACRCGSWVICAANEDTDDDLDRERNATLEEAARVCELLANQIVGNGGAWPASVAAFQCADDVRRMKVDSQTNTDSKETGNG